MSDARRILRFMRPEWGILALSLLATFAYVLLNSASVWMLGSLVHSIFAAPSTATVDPASVADGTINGALKAWTLSWVLRDTPTATLSRLAWLIFCIFFAKNIFLYGKGLCVSFAQAQLMDRLRQTLFGKVMSLPLSFHEHQASGSTASVLVNDVAKLRSSLTESLQKLVTEPLNILVFMGLLFVISWQMTLMALVSLPLSAALIYLLGRSIKRKSLRTSRSIARLMAVLTESLASVRIIQAFGMESHEGKRFGKESSDFSRLAFRQARLAGIASPATELIGISIGLLLLWYGGRVVLQGQGLGSDDFLRYLLILFSVMQPIRNLARINTRLQDGLAGARRVFQLLDTPSTLPIPEEPLPMDGFDKVIRFENVSFQYPGDEKFALDSIDLTIEHGETVALVGSSGAGKSTLADLLPRFRDPTGGQILIDGVPVNRADLSALRALIGAVYQETVLFDASITQNIRYARPDATDEAVISAAKAAQALDFIEALPDGFETMIGERGVRLSGGQRQRISIARAILRDPPILLLDEATSSLDSESEQALQTAIHDLIQDRTVIIIAHRLSTILDADRIVVLDDGRVVESGRHADLLELGGVYRRLHDIQFRDAGHAHPEAAPARLPR